MKKHVELAGIVGLCNEDTVEGVCKWVDRFNLATGYEVNATEMILAMNERVARSSIRLGYRRAAWKLFEAWVCS